MSELRPLAKLYIAVLSLSAVVVTLFGLTRASALTGERLLLAGALGVLLALACAFPLHIADKTKITVDMSILFALTLLFEPGIAMLLAGVGTLVAQLVQRDPAEQALFNGAQAVWQAAAAGLVLSLAGWNYVDPTFGTPAALAAIAGAALSIYLINTLAVAIIVSLDAGESLWSVLRASLSFGIAQEAGLLGLGLFVVVLVNVQIALLPIFLVPAVVLYLSLVWHLRLREQPDLILPVTRLPRSAAVYLAAIGLAALAVIPATLAGLGELDTRTALLALAVAGCVTLAYLYPLDFGFKMKLMLDDGVLFVAILLFEPVVAMLVVGLGVTLDHLIRRQSGAQTVFNSAQVMLQAAVGGLLLMLAGWQPGELAFNQPEQVLMLALIPLALYLVNTLAVATVIGLDQRLDPLTIWRGAASPSDFGLRLVQYGLGLGAALMLVDYPWALPLVVLPGVALYLLLRERRLRAQTPTSLSLPQAGASQAPTLQPQTVPARMKQH